MTKVLLFLVLFIATTQNAESSQFFIPKPKGSDSSPVQTPPPPATDEVSINDESKDRAPFSERRGNVTCLTSKCHSGIGKGVVVHGPIKADGCHVCHIVGKKWEPSAYATEIGENKTIPSDHPKLRRADSAEINATCLLCHDTVGGFSPTARYTHPAIQAGSCVSCHNPHHAQFKNLLNQDPSDPAFCLTCHATMGEKINSFKFKHGAMALGNGCNNCHLTHFSDNKHLLKTADGGICIACHGDKIEKPALSNKQLVTIHDPVLKKRCPECHEPHGSNRERLLSADYSSQMYGKFSKERYALCFKCHTTDLALLPKVGSQTNFRNGAVNLHYLHIQKHKKGLGCETCHNAHSTPGSKLVRSWIPYNVLQLPLVFHPTQTGGSCITACHKLKRYDRVKEATNEKGR